jgi:hypothetical protein
MMDITYCKLHSFPFLSLCFLLVFLSSKRYDHVLSATATAGPVLMFFLKRKPAIHTFTSNNNSIQLLSLLLVFYRALGLLHDLFLGAENSLVDLTGKVKLLDMKSNDNVEEEELVLTIFSIL